jgi:hypothetical protein
MRRIITILTLGFFGFYWSVTFLFTMPDNYMNLSLYKQNQLFQLALYQKWSFFAPPPNFNERLYYEFRKKGDSAVQVFEAVEPICKAKQRKTPFNSKEDLLDYIISGSMNNISDQMYELQQDMKYENGLKGVEKLDSVQHENIRKIIQKSYGFATLKNYAAHVAQANKLDTAHREVRIMLTRIPIPKFADRFKKVEKKEELYFMSEYFKI